MSRPCLSHPKVAALSMRTTLIIVLILAICVILPFLLWGDRIESLLVVDAEAGTLANQDQWAWAVGIGLLIADIVIPIPTTSIMRLSATALVGCWGAQLRGALREIALKKGTS